MALWFLLVVSVCRVASAQAPSFIEYPIPTPHSSPNFIATGPDGALWFTEFTGNNIGRTTTSGAVTEYAVPTTGANPLFIAAGPDDALWFTEFNGNNIGRITTSGAISEYPIPSSSAGPEGITAGSDGALWFAEFHSNNVGRISTSGTIIEYPIPTPWAAPYGIAAGADGALWFTEGVGNNIGRITTSGAITEYAIPTPSVFPYAIAAGPDGALWFTEELGNNIGRITTSGVITEYPIPTPFAHPIGIAAGPDGALWFTESPAKVARITTSGAITEYSIPTPSASPYGMAAGPDGALWFTDVGANRIGRAGLALALVPVTPCRVVDTRNKPGPLGGPALFGSRDFPLPSGSCGIPANAFAYSLNVTVVPSGSLGYLTIWPTGQPQPVVSTLNSQNGIIKADAAIVPAGTSGSVSVYASAPTDVVLDINGYFVPANSSALAFYPVTPCRLVDTRNANGPLGGPIMAAGQTRSFPLPASSCNSISADAQAYSLNFTVAPDGLALGYLTTWPTGQSQPVVSTLNAPTGLTTANAAIVPAGTSGAIEVFTSNTTQVVIDINGYFAPPGTGGLSFYTVYPCRAVDTRNASGPLGGPELFGQRDFPLSTSSCGLPSTAQAYSLNATVVPQTTLGYLTLWPTGQPQPVVSTLNSPDGSTASNAAIVPVGQNGSISAYASAGAQLILDTNGYFAP